MRFWLPTLSHSRGHYKTPTPNNAFWKANPAKLDLHRFIPPIWIHLRKAKHGTQKKHLVDGFNPFEKYAQVKMGSSLLQFSGWKSTNIWNHHLGFGETIILPFLWFACWMLGRHIKIFSKWWFNSDLPWFVSMLFHFPSGSFFRWTSLTSWSPMAPACRHPDLEPPTANVIGNSSRSWHDIVFIFTTYIIIYMYINTNVYIYMYTLFNCFCLE